MANELKGQILVDALCKGEAFLDNDLKPHWNTRPAAPVEGLERYDISMFGNGAVEMGGGEYVRFDQAEAIIAAKDADNAALTERVKELEDKRHDDRFNLLSEMEKAEALETQLAAARKALTDIQCMDWGCLAVSDVFDEINEIVERAALEAKP